MEEDDIRMRIEELAQLQFTDYEIATILRCPVEELRDRWAVAVDRGRLLAEAEVRKSILTMAKQGSSPAQKQILELNKRAKLSARRGHD